MERKLRAAAGAQVGGEAEFERHLLVDEAREQRRVVSGVEGVADSFGPEHVQRAVDRGRADGLAGMDAEAQTGARGLGIDLREKFGSGQTLVAADADADDAAGLEPNGRGNNLFGLLGAEVAHGVEDPVEGDSEIFFTANASALQPLEERIELLSAPED